MKISFKSILNINSFLFLIDQHFLIGNQLLFIRQLVRLFYILKFFIHVWLNANQKEIQIQKQQIIENFILIIKIIIILFKLLVWQATQLINRYFKQPSKYISMSVDDQFKQLLQSENDYEDQIGLFVSHFSSDEASAQKLASRIFKTINSLFTRKKIPIRYYLSARLVKDLMILDQNRFENLCAIEIIPSYNIILQKLANSNIDSKLSEYFGDSIQNDRDRVAARKFFQILLESVSVWGRQIQSNQVFRDNYQQLKQKNVPFPTRFEFYDNEQFEDYYDNQNIAGQYHGEQIRSEEQKNQGNNGKSNNQLNENLAKYQSFQKKLQSCVDQNRQNENQLKNELTILEKQIKENIESLEQDLQVCITNQNQDLQLEQMMEKVFEYQSYFIELEQDIEKYKNGLFDPQRFFSKYGSKNYQNESRTNPGSNKQFDNTPTPQDNMIRNSQLPQQKPPIQQNLYNLNEDEEDNDDNFQQQFQQNKNQTQLSQKNIEQQNQKSQIEQQKLLEQQQLKEQQQREQQIKDQQIKEQQLREKQQKEQLLKEQQQKEQQLREQQQKEQKLREQQQQEQLLREQQQNEQQMIEQQMREYEIAQQLMKDQQQKSQHQALSQIQNKQPQQQQEKSMKLSDLNKIKEQQKQKQNFESDQLENENNFMQNQDKPKNSKNYFQEEEFYDPNRAVAQQQEFKNNNNNNKADNFNSQSEVEQQNQQMKLDQKFNDQSRIGYQSEYQEKSFKSFTNESYRNKHYQSMIVKSNSQSKFTKTINENLEKYIQPYASSKIGFNQSISNMDRTEQTKSQGPEKKKPVFSQNEKLKEVKQENVNLQSKIVELQSNVKMLSQADKNQYLVELKQQNDENTRRIQEQNEIIKQLQESLASIQDENNKLKSQGSSLSNNLENEQLKSQISKLQHDYQELLYHQRNTQRSENQMSFPDGNIESHPQYQALIKQNEDLKSRLSQQGGSSNHGSLIHNQASMPPSSNFPIQSPNSQARGRIDNYQSVPAGGQPSKRYQSPKIFQEFRPRGVDEQVLRQSVDSLNIQGYQSSLMGLRQQNPQIQQNAPQNTFNNNGLQLDQQNQQRFKQNSGSLYNSQVNQSGNNHFKQHQPIFSQQLPPNIIRRTFESPQQQSYKGGMDNIVSQFNGSDQQVQKLNIKREFNTPPSQQGQRIPSSGNGQNNHTSPKRIFDGIGDMKDVSQIPSIIFNDKREEIESIQKNNQSTQSYNESVKEILNPLSTKNNLPQDQQLVSKNTNKSKPLNFSEVKEGEEVKFDKNLFSLILQYVAKLNRFKASCLKTKYPIYEDSQVQIGVVTNHQQQNGGNYFRVQLYYSNKGSRSLKNLKVTVLDEQKNYQVHVSPEIIAEIEPKQQKKQELLIAYSYMPFNPCFISINYSGVSPLYLGLPNTVNKMFQYKDINKDLFKRQFKERKYIKYIYIPECNPKFAKTHQDFKMYLEKLVDLNPESEFDHIQGTSKFKMGLQFSLDQYSNERNPQDYLMKIVCNPDQSAHIFIAFSDYNQNDKVEFILNTFCFLFSSNKGD
ncbi:transmembrane protein, putative (macronuclear) [Tetrahymena thermophila SB210]|uniref:Transmembrane protein, putative n=1 Tax=Tetrahymena thermophila (strain SB210) TaxID=312017 RepID=I7M288_TETTS|nr:transmembrane protein, putative [Tetrahymena thermophila SB210]EAR99539.2 transmembrane protein, putative [Tetrahymena thermophila SB210]|eukprot:XP_001019784.2 transmembrane protein, putative [Tetrahymena thermophila SB210]